MSQNLEIAGSLKRTEKGHNDWYYGGGSTHWPSREDALNGVPIAVRETKTVAYLVDGNVVEAWWKSGTTNDDLIEKGIDVSGVVLTVNGIEPDNNGNVEIEAGTTGNFIPLSGTDLESPVTGNVIFNNDTGSSLKLGIDSEEKPIVQFGFAENSVTIKPATLNAGAFAIIIPNHSGGNVNLPLSVNGVQADGVGNITLDLGSGSIPDLPEGRIAFGGSDGKMTSNADLIFNPSINTLTTFELNAKSLGYGIRLVEGLFDPNQHGIYSGHSDQIIADYNVTLDEYTYANGAIKSNSTTALDVTGDVKISTTSYPDGLFSIDNTGGEVRIGDVFGDNNNNYIKINDNSEEITYDAANHRFLGTVKFDDYGNGNFTGTPTYNIQIDADGNVIEGIIDQLRNKGEWILPFDVPYYVNDVVLYNDQYWICIQETISAGPGEDIGEPDSEPDYWKLLGPGTGGVGSTPSLQDVLNENNTLANNVDNTPFFTQTAITIDGPGTIGTIGFNNGKPQFQAENQEHDRSAIIGLSDSGVSISVQSPIAFSPYSYTNIDISAGSILIAAEAYIQINSKISINTGTSPSETLEVAGNIKLYTGFVTADSYYTTGGVSWSSGTGSPEGVVYATRGSLYSRTDGGANTTLYVKEGFGAGNTGWVAK